MEDQGGKSGVEGWSEPGWSPVRRAFELNFEEHGDIGAAICVYHEGRCVVDLAGGVAPLSPSDPVDDAPPYRLDTLQLVFSTTKGMTALCANLLIERGELDVRAPVASYWPEFEEAGKRDLPVSFLLSHRAGLPTIDETLPIEEVLAWQPVIEALAGQKPFWEPGTAHGYHALTFGWLVGEVIRRVSGMSVGAFFAKEIAAPLGLETWIGLPEAEESRVAPVIMGKLDIPDPFTLASENPAGLAGAAGLGGAVGPGGAAVNVGAAVGEAGGDGTEGLGVDLAELVKAFLSPDSLFLRALSLNGSFGMMPPDFPYNRRDLRAAEIPSANGITTARSLARMYASTIGEVDGIRLLRPETVADMTGVESDGPDKVLVAPTRFGRGFMLHSPFSLFTGDGAFGHSGAGGSLGFADPAAGVGFAYVMNEMRMNLAGDPRAASLVDAVRYVLAGRG